METSLLVNLVVGIAVALVAATATATILWYPTPSSGGDGLLDAGPPPSPSFPAAANSARSMAGPSEATIEAIQQLQTSVLPGELAGYTGWARPIYTLAPTIRVTNYTWAQNTFTVHLKSTACNPAENQRTKFYARASGPSVLTGRTKTFDGCVHQVAFDFHDPGRFWLEIVLTFSHGLSPEEFPLKGKDDDDYEGYYIPAFPRSIDVAPARLKDLAVDGPSPERQCRISDVQVVDSQKEAGRWVFDNRPSFDTTNVDKTDKKIDLSGYKSARNAAGMIFKYQYMSNCKVPSSPLPTTGPQTHVLFVGDSNFKIQSTYLHDAMESENVVVRHVSNSGGMQARQNIVKKAAVQLSQQAEAAGSTFIIFFNSGLHDIYQLCSSKKAEERASDDFFTSKDDYSCVDHYKAMLQNTVEHFLNLPSKPRVFFQTTTAAFPKWGNYGSVWPADEGQPYTLSPDFIMQINEIAVKFLTRKYPDTVTIVDGFWTSHARPDDRFVDTEIAVDKSFERELVHPGHQVQEAHLELWTTILADVISQQNSDANPN
eukprot:CAMPEP_0194070824 /NCGR_PEP_ID=MMETSP0009_2-20130614/88382_1 /TAXON_ID=210454 /ORGANISM="Grammatophora oceanica, Strain CCMP 410" /LENGTH=541 /DNA_ID=CAMNT_0038724111 /DNA_START=101 /DNA_END=1726 /DNA_ORIENTATION=+